MLVYEVVNLINQAQNRDQCRALVVLKGSDDGVSHLGLLRFSILPNVRYCISKNGRISVKGLEVTSLFVPLGRANLSC
jgi:hypothetical protein